MAPQINNAGKIFKCEYPGDKPHTPKPPEDKAPEEGTVMEAFKKDVFGNNKQLKRRS